MGYDPDQQLAYDVAVHSAESKGNVEVKPLDLEDLRMAHLYTRPVDPLASTPFTFSRYLVPYLQGYKGWAMFTDCDVLFMDDPTEIMQHADESKAVCVVKHDYTSAVRKKMNDKTQHTYERKNWTSVMLINCAHPSNAVLTPDLVNDKSKSGVWFHKLSWLKDEEIGELPHTWNYLTDHYKGGSPHILHYTLGGPWQEGFEDCAFASEWNKELKAYK